MNRTSGNFLNIFGSLAMAFAVAVSAHAQNAPLSANIPFNFKVGETSFSCGTHTIETLNGALLIRSLDRKASAVTLANAASPPYSRRSSRLIFKTYRGNPFYLPTVEWSGGPCREIAPSRTEIEFAKKV